jgi:hypothetical protein
MKGLKDGLRQQMIEKGSYRPIADRKRSVLRAIVIGLLSCSVLLGLGMSKRPYGANLLPNSSFEVTTTGDMPDCWDQYGGPWAVRGWHSLWKVDRTQSYDGRNSILLEITDNSQIGKIALKPSWSKKTVRIFQWDKLKVGQTYTFSVYMKSGREGIPVNVALPQENIVRVGKEWKRFVFRVKAMNETSIRLSISPLSIGKVWIDAMQLEQDSVATPYRPSTLDASLFKTSAPKTRDAIARGSFLPSSKISSFRIKTDFSFYMQDRDARLICELPGSANVQAAESLKIELQEEGERNGVVVYLAALNTLKDNQLTISFPLGGIRPGKHRIRAFLLGKKGEELISTSTELVKMPPKHNAVRIDQVRRCFVVDDESFFFFGAAFLRATKDMQRVPEILKQIRDQGYTVVIPTFSSWHSEYHASDNEIIRFFDFAQKLGLKVIPWVEPNAIKSSSRGLKLLRRNSGTTTVFASYAREIERLVLLLKDQPALLAWYLFDEPGDTQWITLKYNKKLIDYARSLDPYHPLYINYGALQADMTVYDGTVPGDIVSATQYPVPLRPLTWVAEKTDLEAIASENRKPVCIWLQFWGGHGRYPTSDELICMTYLSAIHGSTCFASWPLMPGSKTLWEGTKGLIAEIRKIFPILLTTEGDVGVETDSAYVHFAAREYQNKTYILAVNTLSESEKVSFRIRGYKRDQAARLSVLFENRTINVSDVGFADEFGGFSRHVYIVEREGEK